MKKGNEMEENRRQQKKHKKQTKGIKIKIDKVRI